MRVTHMHGSSVSAERMSSSLCHLTFSLLMFHPSLLLLFLDGHFETTPDYDLTDSDVHDFLPNFPDLNELFGYLAKSALNTRRRPNKWIWVESEIENVHKMTFSVRHLKRKLVHLQKIMGVSDVQVSDRDGFKSRSNTIKAKSKIVKERIWTLDSHFANKIVTEQIQIISVTSKIVFQLLEIDTDAQLHKERVISVRKEAVFLSRVLQEMSQLECGHPGNFLSM